MYKLKFPKKFCSFYCFVLLMICFSSCEYQPKDIFNNPTTTDEGMPAIEVVNLNLDEDTIYLYTDKKVDFKFSTSNQKIRSLTYLVNEEVKQVVESDNGTFTIRQDDFFDGIHTLTVRLFTESGTGSIADQIGAEGYLFEKQWVLVVDRTSYRQTSHSSENGRLRLDWAEFRGSDLKEYVVYRSGANDKAGIIGRTIANHIIDSCYAGEGTNYSVHAITKDGQDVWWGSWQLAAELPLLSSSSNFNNQSYVYWTKSIYFNNVGSVKVYRRNENTYIYEYVYSSLSISDTAYFIKDVMFGDEISMCIELIPKKYNFEYDAQPVANNRVYADVTAGFKFLENSSISNPIYFVENNEMLFASHYDGLIRYSLTDLKITQSYPYRSGNGQLQYFDHLEVSPKGKYFAAYIFDEMNVMTGLTANPGYNSVSQLQSLIGQSVRNISISDNRIGLVNSLIGGIYLYDFNTSSVLAEYTLDPTVANGFRISSNGNYMFIVDYKYHLVQYFNNQFIVKYTFDNPPKIFVEFSKTSPDQFVLWDGSVFSLKNCSDLSNVYSYPLADAELLSVDYLNGEILTGNSTHLYVRKLSDGTLLHDIPVKDDNMYSRNRCYLMDHKIISTTGVLYFL